LEVIAGKICRTAHNDVGDNGHPRDRAFPPHTFILPSARTGRAWCR
jgi:hypothetical protein